MKRHVAVLSLVLAVVFAVSATAATITIPRDTVVPVVLDNTLSSSTDVVGQTFQATHTGANGAGFPEGTVFNGRVTSVTKANWKTPGQVGVSFYSARLPDGQTVSLNGKLTSLDNSSVRLDPNGRLVATSSAKKSNTKFIAYGAGAGLILGQILGKHAATGAILGAAAGYLYGKKHAEPALGKNVQVAAGTQVGVLLTNNVRVASSSYVAPVGPIGSGPATGSYNVSFSGVRPMTVGSEIMLPARYVMDKMGLPFSYDTTSRTLRTSYNGSEYVQRVGTNQVTIDGTTSTLYGRSMFINGTLYVPASFIERVTGRTVSWTPGSSFMTIH